MIPLQTASPHPVTHILFSLDGLTVAVAQPHYGVTLLERATGHTLAVCAMPRRSTLTGLAFCADGRFLAAAHPKGLEVFDAATGARVFASFHYPQHLLLASRGDALLGIPSKRSTALRMVLKVTDSTVSPTGAKAIVYRRDLAPLACAADGSRVLGVEGNRYTLLDSMAKTPDARLKQSAPAECSEQSIAAFCPLGRRFAINDGHTLDVYDTGALATEDEDEQQADTPLVQRASGTRQHAAQATAVAPMPHVLLSPTFTLKPDRASAERWYPPFALAADGRGVLVKRPRNRIQLWNAPTGTLVNEWSWRLEWVTCVAVASDGLTAIAGGRFGRVLIWDLE